MGDSKTDWACGSNPDAALVHCCKERDQKKGKALDSDQKNEITDTSSGNELSLKGGWPLS